MKFAIIYGSVRKARQGIKAAKFIKNKFEEKGHQVTLIDPLEKKLPLLDLKYEEFPEGEAPESMKEISKILTDAEGFLIVTGEYNHDAPPALKNLIDHFMREYLYKPSGIISYSAGSFGGVRAATHLRDVLAEVGMSSIPTTFPISKVQDSFDENGNAIDAAYNRRIEKFIKEFEWYAKALKEARAKGTP